MQWTFWRVGRDFRDLSRVQSSIRLSRSANKMQNSSCIDHHFGFNNSKVPLHSMHSNCSTSRTKKEGLNVMVDLAGMNNLHSTV